ncbi:alpha/beta fold hydrolase, partial [Candidatus Woesearchaeota archaeon]|nr:alpha/beta fold hydrolase [Candidatus Woesearchaeota archaeon]
KKIFLLIILLLLLLGCSNNRPKIKDDVFSRNNLLAPVDGFLATEDGKKIAYSFFEKPESKFGIVLVHMLDRTRHDFDDFAKTLQAAGYSVISIDMRGHGESTPKWRWRAFSEPEFKTIIYDVKAASNFLVSKNIQNVILIGASIGANTVLNYGGADRAVKAIVLLSPGLDYRGVRVLDAANENFKPLFVIASEDDLYAFTSSQEIIKASMSSVEDEKYYEDAGHGTDMFKKERVDLEIISWLFENDFK